MKFFFTLLIMWVLTASMTGQTLKLVPTETVPASGVCTNEYAKKYMCYSLEYTPEVSGVLTSYTTAFFISCTSKGSAVATNRSCSMSGNVNLINGCGSNGTVLVNCSGNTGTSGNNNVIAGQPVIIHQICFTIPEGESITIREDPVTDLTTSVDITGGESKTEYPVFAEMKIKKEKTLLVKPLWLDFKSIAAGHRMAQLDWTTSIETNNSHYLIERSANGVDFEPLGRVESASRDRINSYQYLDNDARLGNNYYRLVQVGADGSTKFSPVRVVTFEETPFSVKASPNPADEFIMVAIQSPVDETRIQLMDASGRVVIDETTSGKSLNTRLNTAKLPTGVYSLIVESAAGKFNEKISIVH